mgnify:CR=1 FL=1
MRIGRAALLAELERVGLAVFDALAAGDALGLVHLGNVVGADRVARAVHQAHAQAEAGAGAAVADDVKYTDFTADLNAGYWLVIVSGTVDEEYNPMLVGVYYSANGSDNTMTSNPVNADSNWTLETSIAYAKSTTPSIKKEIVDGETAKGNDVAIGDTVNFKITTTIPSYSKQYDTVTCLLYTSDAADE